MSSLSQRHRGLPLLMQLNSSAYQVVVEEERPRRARGTAEILRCYPVPIHFQNATALNSPYYFTAQFPAGGVQAAQPFTVGDNKTYNGYWNAPLLPQKSYSVYYQAVSTANGARGSSAASRGPVVVLNENQPQSRSPSAAEARPEDLGGAADTSRAPNSGPPPALKQGNVLEGSAVDRDATAAPIGHLRRKPKSTVSESPPKGSRLREARSHSGRTPPEDFPHTSAMSISQDVPPHDADTPRVYFTRISVSACNVYISISAILVTQLTTPYVRIVPAAGDSQLTGAATLKPDAVEPEKQTDHTVKIAGVIAGILLFVIIFLGVVLLMKKRRTYQSYTYYL
ncbi:unnamed protein product [Boreogadus saida]